MISYLSLAFYQTLTVHFEHPMIQIQCLVKKPCFCIPTYQHIPRKHIPLLHLPKHIPSITQITKLHKHTQQSITDAYRKDKIRRCKMFGNGENEGKQKKTFE
ncbi:hypothetical protein ACJW30_09G013400 [Castanea mollissima]